MSLNDLQLSSSMIARLYPSSLVSPDGEDAIQISKKQDVTGRNNQKTESNAAESWKSLGNNQQNILIVVNYADSVHLPDEELSFLTSMLTACKLSLGDVAIINTNNYERVNCKDILTQFKSRIVFLFGIEPLDFGLPAGFPHFQVQTVSNCTFLYTPALEERHTDALLKSKLWVSLRSIFSI